MTEPTPTPVTDPLSIVTLETERYVAAAGWDQAPRLFALVPTADLLQREPGMATGAEPRPGDLTAIEQDELPEAGTVEELLGQIAWPPAVVGAAIALERIVVPPSAERDLPKDPDEAARVLAAHPEREDVRLLAACLRDGTATCLLRQRSHDRDDRVARGQDIAPGLLHALRTTLED